MTNIATYLIEVASATNKTKNLIDYLREYSSLFSKLNIELAPNLTTRLNLNTQTKVEIKWLSKHTVTRNIEPFKQVTTWYLATVFYEGVPFAIIRSSGTCEDPYPSVLLINKLVHKYAGAYLFQYLEEDPGPNLEPYDIIGSYSGDILDRIININHRYYELPQSEVYLSQIINYTELYFY